MASGHELGLTNIRTSEGGAAGSGSESQPSTPTTPSVRRTGSFSSEDIIALEMQSRQLASRRQSSESRHSGSPVASRSNSLMESVPDIVRTRRHSKGSGGGSPRKQMDNSMPSGVPTVVARRLTSPTPDALREKLHQRRRYASSTSITCDCFAPTRWARTPQWIPWSGSRPGQVVSIRYRCSSATPTRVALPVRSSDACASVLAGNKGEPAPDD